jgi:hypothetical protein
MNRESFLESVRQQYSERINASYMLCEHGGRINIEELGAMLKPLKRMAAREGLTHGEFDELVFSLFPDVRGHLDLDVTSEFQRAA